MFSLFKSSPLRCYPEAKRIFSNPVRDLFQNVLANVHNPIPSSREGQLPAQSFGPPGIPGAWKASRVLASRRSLSRRLSQRRRSANKLVNARPSYIKERRRRQIQRSRERIVRRYMGQLPELEEQIGEAFSVDADEMMTDDDECFLKQMKVLIDGQKFRAALAINRDNIDRAASEAEMAEREKKRVERDARAKEIRRVEEEERKLRLEKEREAAKERRLARRIERAQREELRRSEKAARRRRERVAQVAAAAARASREKAALRAMREAAAKKLALEEAAVTAAREVTASNQEATTRVATEEDTPARRHQRVLALYAVEESRQRTAAEQFSLYNTKWLELKANPSLRDLLFVELPWPVLGPIALGPDDLSYGRIVEFVFDQTRPEWEGKSRREVLKGELLRWHPDKFEGKVLVAVADWQKAIVKKAAGWIASVLTQMLEEEAKRNMN